ncbi:MAG: di-heme oxidoredictase family protein [Kofleriaceae bacterium]
MQSIARGLVLLLVGCTTEESRSLEQVSDLDTALMADVDAAGMIARADPAQIGREVGLSRHMKDGEELNAPVSELVSHGKDMFEAVWTPQEGAGRPLTKGNGTPLTDPSSPLVFPRNFDRLSAADSNACTSCHSVPRAGGGGHFSAGAFLPMHRFDFMTFDHSDPVTKRGAMDEQGKWVTLETAGDFRHTIGMFGAGYIEMLARQMTTALQAQRDQLHAGSEVALQAKGVRFGILRRDAAGAWDTSRVEGLPAQALASAGPQTPPTLILQPFHQSGTVVSLRQFSNNAFNHHHGMQSAERFGADKDPDGDGMTNELSRADITAVAVYQATLPVPGRVIPRNRAIERAVWAGEQAFEQIGCASCHMTSLPLTDKGWVFSEPNPFNPPDNLQVGTVPSVEVNLNGGSLPGPRLSSVNGVVHVPAYTDLKLHDISSAPHDPNWVPIDLNAPPGSPAFFAGNSRWLTKKLWGVANSPPYFHHGKFTTMREAIEAHAGEAQAQADSFRGLDTATQNALIEFLKSLQVLPAGATALVVDEWGHPRSWPPSHRD